MKLAVRATFFVLVHLLSLNTFAEKKVVGYEVSCREIFTGGVSNFSAPQCACEMGSGWELAGPCTPIYEEEPRPDQDSQPTKRSRDQGSESGSSAGAGAPSYEAVRQKCEAAYQSARDDCGSDGSVNSLGQTAISQAGGAFAGAQDPCSQCKALKMQAAAGVGLTGLVFGNCYLSKGTCEDECKPTNIKCEEPADNAQVGGTWGDQRKIREWESCTRARAEVESNLNSCTKLTKNMLMSAGFGLAGSGSYFAQMKACEQMMCDDKGGDPGGDTAGIPPDICDTPQGEDIRGCPKYCLKWTSDPSCGSQIGGDYCRPDNPAARDNPGCAFYCQYHPEDKARCPSGGTPGGPGNGPGNNGDGQTGSDTNFGGFGSLPAPAGGSGGGLDMPDDELNGDLYNPPTGGGGSPLAFGANDSNGGGGGGQGPAPYAPGAEKSRGGRGNPFNKDIDGGFRGGGGGYSVSGVPLGGGGYGGAGQNGGKDDKLDLSKYLPKDETRGPAADELKAMGIATANDLSNWERITRKMTQKRAVLLPGQVNRK